MVTSKLVSNIFYGNREQLHESLNGLVKNGMVAWWCTCAHYGERAYNPVKGAWVGERLKDHIHVGIKPNKRLDMDIVYNECMQLETPTKTVGFTRNWVFVRSNTDFWLYLYHDRDYCDKKGLVREYYYKIEDVVCSDEDIKNYELYRAREDLWSILGVSNEVMQCAEGRRSEVALFSRHLRDAYGIDKMLKAAKRELYGKKDQHYNEASADGAVCQVALGL